MDECKKTINALILEPDSFPSLLAGHLSTPSSLSVFEQMKKLQETVRQKTKVEIGDVVRVRGHIRTYRQQREIQASCLCECYDSVMYVTKMSESVKISELYVIN